MEQNKVDQINTLIHISELLSETFRGDVDYLEEHYELDKLLTEIINQKENDLLRLSKSGR